MRRFGIICAIAATLGAATLALGASSEEGGKQFKIVLDNSFGLTTGADLKSAGVRVGKVSDLDVQRSTGRALITVDIKREGFGSFRKDVFCEVEPQSLIGEYFINCEPGKSAEQLPEGATIPVEQTSGTIPPDLVVSIMRKPQRERFGTILSELGAGLAARGEDLNATIRRALPALRETDEVLELLAANAGTLRSLTRDADVVLDALSDNRGDVARFVSEARDTSVASAERRTELAATIHKLPAFLRALRPMLGDLSTVARAQTPALRDLRVSAGDLTTLLERLGPFSEAARPAVRSLGTASVVGLQAARSARPTVRSLRRTAEAAKEPSTNLRFVLEHVNDRANAVEPNRLSPGGSGFTGLEAFLQYIFVQAQAINIYDAKGHILKLNIFINECSQYANAQTLRDHPDRAQRCSQALGPSAPGISPTRRAASRRTSGQRTDELPAALKPVTTGPSAAAPETRRQPAAPAPSNDIGRLLDRLLPDLPKVQLPEGLTSRRDGASVQELLDYLLAP